MKLRVTQKALREAVESASRAANGNNEAGGKLLLRAGAGELSVEGDNGSIRISATAEAIVERDGTSVVPAAELRGFLSKVVGDTVDLEEDSGGETNGIIVTSGRARARLNLGDPELFPKWEEEPGGPPAELPGEQLARQAKQVLAFAQKPGAGERPSLEAVSIRAKHGRILLEAADGTRMSLSEMDLPESDGRTNIDVLAPAVALSEAVRNLRGGGETLTISGGQENRTVDFLISQVGSLSSVEISSRQMARRDSFPVLKELIPKEWETRFIVDSADLKRAVEEAIIFAGKENKIAILQTRGPKEEGDHSVLMVNARSPESGEVHDEIMLGEHAEGENAWMAIRCEFLADAVNAAGSDELDIEIGGEGKPCVVRQNRQDGEESEVTIVMMPLMVPRDDPGEED